MVLTYFSFLIIPTTVVHATCFDPLLIQYNMDNILSWNIVPFGSLGNASCKQWLWRSHLPKYILPAAVLKIRKNSYRSDVQVTFELYGHFRSFIPKKITFTKYSLTKWISKLPGSFEIHWVGQYLANSIGLVGKGNATVYKTKPIFTSLRHDRLSWFSTLLLSLAHVQYKFIDFYVQAISEKNIEYFRCHVRYPYSSSRKFACHCKKFYLKTIWNTIFWNMAFSNILFHWYQVLTARIAKMLVS